MHLRRSFTSKGSSSHDEAGGGRFSNRRKESESPSANFRNIESEEAGSDEMSFHSSFSHSEGYSSGEGSDQEEEKKGAAGGGGEEGSAVIEEEASDEEQEKELEPALP